MPHQRDFGSDLPESSSASSKPNNARGLPSAWLDDADYEESSNANKTVSQAKAIVKEALVDLERAVSEANTERVRRRTLRTDYYAAKDWEMASVTVARGNEKPALIYKTPRSEYYAIKDRVIASATAAKDNEKPVLAGPTIQDILSKASSVASSKDRRSHVDPSLDSGPLPGTLSSAVPAQGNVSSVTTGKVRRSNIQPPTSTVVSNDKSGLAAPAQRNVPKAPTIKPTRSVVHPSLHSIASSSKPSHALPSQGGVANVATGKVGSSSINPSLNSGGQNAGRAQHSVVSPSLMPEPLARGGAHTAATRRYFDGGFTSEDRLAAARVKLRANEQRVTGKTIQQLLSSGASATTKGAPQGPVQPEPSRVSATLDTPTRPKRDNSMSTSGTDQTNTSISNAAKQPARNNVAATPSSADKSKSENEAGRRSTSHPGSSTLPSSNTGQAAKSSSTQPAAATAASTTTTPNPPVGEKAKAIAHHDATHKLAQGTDRIEFDTGKTLSTPASLKKPASNPVQSLENLSIKSKAAKTTEVDSGFDIVNATGPSAANGSPLPDPDLIMDQLDEQFSPTLKGFQGWEDDYVSDDSEEWDLGGLAEWKWVGEKSAKKDAAERQA